MPRIIRIIGLLLYALNFQLSNYQAHKTYLILMQYLNEKKQDRRYILFFPHKIGKLITIPFKYQLYHKERKDPELPTVVESKCKEFTFPRRVITSVDNPTQLQCCNAITCM